MQILDSLMEGPLRLRNQREGDELIGMIVRYLVTGQEPEPRTDAQEAVLVSVWPVMQTSRARRIAGAKGGSSTASKAAGKREGKAEGNGGGRDASAAQGKRPREEEEEEEEEEKPKTVEIPAEVAEIVSFLNRAAHTSYRTTTPKTRALIAACMREGFTVVDFKTVISKKCAEWAGTDMQRYLRPETLFGTKFEGYLNDNTRPRGGGDYAAYD